VLPLVWLSHKGDGRPLWSGGPRKTGDAVAFCLGVSKKAMRVNQLGILLVDGDGAARLQVAEMLRQIGVAALHLADSVAAAQPFLPDPAVDVMLVGHPTDCPDPLTFVAAAHRARHHLAIIQVCDYGDLWRLGQAKAAGARDFLVAPFSTRSLIQRLARATQPAQCLRSAFIRVAV